MESTGPAHPPERGLREFGRLLNQRLSLRTTLMLVLAVTLVVPAIVVLVVGQRIAREQQAVVVAESVQSVMTVGASSLVDPLWAIDAPATRAAADRLLDNPIVVGLRVREERPGVAPIERFREPVARALQRGDPVPGLIERRVDIRREGLLLGSLQVWFDASYGSAAIAQGRNQLMWLVSLQALMGLLVLGLFLSRRVVGPIETLKARAVALTQRGAAPPPALPAPARLDELGELAQHLQQAHEQLHAAFESLEEKNRQLEHMALYDGLTGLPNRRLFRDYVEREIGRAHRERVSFGLMFLDVDRFKTVNDALGHALGDQLLMEVARRLSACLRDVDVVCRHSGDEFMLLIRDVVGWEELANVSERLLKSMSEPVVLGESPTRVSVSIGIALFPDDARDFENLVRHADAAMYQAKALGRARYSFFHPDLNARRQANVALEQQLAAALDHRQFELHYQPQLDAVSGQVKGCEALLRWRHPERGLLAPGAFIGIAEESGRVADIGLWVRDEACRQLAEWRGAGVDPGVVALNVSALEFRDHRLLDSLRESLQLHGIAPSQLEIEITESALMADSETTLRIIERLRELGVGLAVDDFGTGYSSLAYLKRLRPNRLKIDRSFVRDIGTDADDRAIVRGVIDLAHAMGMEVLAEGVEEPVQRDFLTANGCRLVQGYLLARPMPAAEFTRWLAGHAASRPATAVQGPSTPLGTANPR